LGEEASYYMSLSLKLKVGTWDDKMFFPYTHASKTQEFNHKMNVVPIYLETNIGMNVSIHPHYGLMFCFIIKLLWINFSPIILIN
jgi:hypothetical protein